MCTTSRNCHKKTVTISYCVPTICFSCSLCCPCYSIRRCYNLMWTIRRNCHKKTFAISYRFPTICFCCRLCCPICTTNLGCRCICNICTPRLINRNRRSGCDWLIVCRSDCFCSCFCRIGTICYRSCRASRVNRKSIICWRC